MYITSKKYVSRTPSWNSTAGRNPLFLTCWRPVPYRQLLRGLGIRLQRKFSFTQPDLQTCLYSFISLNCKRKSSNRLYLNESIHEVIGSCTQGWSVGWLVGWLVGWSSGVNFHCMQMSLVMRRWFISSGDFDGARFWSRFGFVTLHAQPCACH